MAAPPEALVTVPVKAPAAGRRLTLTFGVVWPAVTVAVTVWVVKLAAAAVRVRLPGGRLDKVYAPELLVVALTPPLSVRVAPEMAAPPMRFVTVPATAPGMGVRLKLRLVVACAAVT